MARNMNETAGGRGKSADKPGGGSPARATGGRAAGTAPTAGVSKATAQACAAVMKAMGHPTRVMVLHALQHQECCECDLLGMFRVTQPTLSRHLAVLKRSGLVTERQAGPRKFLVLETRTAQAHVARVHDLMKAGGGR